MYQVSYIKLVVKSFGLKIDVNNSDLTHNMKNYMHRITFYFYQSNYVRLTKKKINYVRHNFRRKKSKKKTKIVGVRDQLRRHPQYVMWAIYYCDKANKRNRISKFKFKSHERERESR